MKKFIILFLVIIAGFLFTTCGAMEYVYYCPYCGTGNVEKTNLQDVYKCSNEDCAKVFGSKEIKN